MAVETVLVFILAWYDFALAAGLTSTIFSVTLLAISIVCFWAAYATCRKDPSWLLASLLGQVSIAMLAVYAVVIDVRSPFRQINVGVIIAGLVGIIAIFWVVYLLGHRSGQPLPKWTPSILALIPALGFVQFWLQTDYLPRTSLPLVDVTSDLTPTGKTGERVQLQAKVTINNRGPVPLNVAATVMRITEYPRVPGKPTQVPDAIKFGFTPSHEYRADPLPTDKRTPIYVKDLYPAGAVLAPGESNTFRIAVDFDTGTMRLAHLSVDAIFITPKIASVYTCSDPQKSQEDMKFQEEIDKVQGDKDTQYKCRELRLVPRNVIHKLVADQPSVVVFAFLNDPKNQSAEYPTLFLLPGTPGNYSLKLLQLQRFSDANPMMPYYNTVAEYIPSEQSALPGGTPSTTPPPSTTQPR